MTLQAGRIYGGVGRLGAARQGGATPWWLSGGIAAANCVAAYQPKGAASKEASILSLTGANDLVENGTVTFSALAGWAGFTESNYFTGTFALSTDYSYIARYAGANTNPNYRRVLAVGGTSVEPVQIVPYGLDGTMYVINNNFVWSGARVAAGVIASTPSNGYINGVVLTGGYAQTIGTYTGNVWKIGRGVGTINHFDGSIQALAIYNTTLTAPQVAALSAAMAAL